MARVYLDQIYKLHGAPESIVSDQDRVFLNHFWQQLFKHLGTKLHVSTAYHPQTNEQIEILSKCMEGYLRCMIGEMPSKWSTWLPLEES